MMEGSGEKHLNEPKVANKQVDLPKFIHSKDALGPCKASDADIQKMELCTDTDDKNDVPEPVAEENASDESSYDVVGLSRVGTMQHSFSEVRRSKLIAQYLNETSHLPSESMVVWKNGVPGSYSGFQISSKDAIQKPATLSSPAVESGGSQNKFPPQQRSTLPHRSSPNKPDDEVDVRDYDLLSEVNQSASKVTGSTVLLETGVESNNSWVETGVRMYDPNTLSSPCRPASAVLLPMSTEDDISDAESWGSTFDESEEEIYDVIGEPRDINSVSESDACYENSEAITRPPPEVKPPLPPRNSKFFDALPDSSEVGPNLYIAVNIDVEELAPALLPHPPPDASNNEVKRYQIIRCIIENERNYMLTLNRLIKDYEYPLYQQNIVNADRVGAIFNHLHEIVQCHQLFNMALSYRTQAWKDNPTIGDVIFASFSKAVVLRAYGQFVLHFSSMMDVIKETCRLVPAFLTFLKLRLYRNNLKQSLYDLLRQPLERIPQMVVLLQELMKVTPYPHSDRLPLQMALTHLECLAETLYEKHRDSLSRHKVKQLDSYCTGLKKSLASDKRYYIRHDDMLSCRVKDGNIDKTKLRRLFILSDLVVCVSYLNRKKVSSLSSKKYRVKWCVPVVDVHVSDFGSGISVKVQKTTTTIKYTHPVASPVVGAKHVQLLEDLQHDIAVIGEIASHVSSLRNKYEVLNTNVMTQLFNQVKETLDKETELANMHWLEVSVPVHVGSRKSVREDRMTCLFNVSIPIKKTEWCAELENAKLRLADDNNPGWYLLENEALERGEVAVLRRTLPLASHFLPLFVFDQKLTVECMAEVTRSRWCEPRLWLLGGSEHVGQVAIVEMAMSKGPRAVESFVACESRILCADVVFGSSEEGPDARPVFVWCGTMSGSVLVFDPLMDERRAVASARLRDAVVSLKYVRGKVFAGLANGAVACFRRRMDNIWDMSNPTVVCLDKMAVLCLAEAGEKLWCAAGIKINVVDTVTLGIENVLSLADDSKGVIKHLVGYGIGVWVSMWKSPILHLYHAETLQHLQTINIRTPLLRMKHDVDGRVQGIPVDKAHTTAILAGEGLLWVGTSAGLVLTYPLPRLGGVPTVSGQACVSFHAHDGPIRCFHAFRLDKQSTGAVDSYNTCGNRKGKPIFYRDSVNHSTSEEDMDGRQVESDVQRDQGAPAGSSTRSALFKEPVYYTVEPDKPLLSFAGDARANQIAADSELASSERPTGDSEDDVDPDQEFSFIEDEVKRGKVSRPPSSSLLKGSFTLFLRDGDIQATQVKSDLMPAVQENAFVELMESFEGFADDERGKIGSLTAPLPKTHDGGKQASPDNLVGSLRENLSKEISASEKIGHCNAILPPAVTAGFISGQTHEAQGKVDQVSSNCSLIESACQVGPCCSEDKTVAGNARVLSNSGYELPVNQSEALDRDLAHVDQQNEDEMRGITQNIDLALSDHYRLLSLPDSPEKLSLSTKSDGEDGLGTTNRAAHSRVVFSTPKESARSMSSKLDLDSEVQRLDAWGRTPDRALLCDSSSGHYTPLIADASCQPQTPTDFDLLGISAYDKELSLSLSTVRQPGDRSYASLTSLLYRDEGPRRDSLLQPWYVLSVGSGRIDLRKKVRASSGMEFLRSFSTPNPEPHVFIWKVTI